MRATPTFVVVNGGEETIDRWLGYSRPIEFANQLAAALAHTTTLAQREAAFAKNPTETEAAELGRISGTKGDFKQSVDYYRTAGKLRGDPDEYSGEIFENVSAGYMDTLYTFDELKASADAILGAKKPNWDDRLMVGYMMIQICREAKKADTAAPYLKAAVEDTGQLADPSLADLRTGLRPDYALIVLKDPVRAVEFKKAALPEGWLTNPQRLNSFAWWCFENRVNLAEADSLGRAGLALATDPKDKAMIADTVAEICAARGNAAEAVRFSEESVKDDPEKALYRKQVERFRKAAAEAGEGKK